MIEAKLDLPESHREVLWFLIENVPPAENVWTLTGSAGLRLQGVDLTVHDLDVLTDLETLYLFERKMASFMNDPVRVWESQHTYAYHAKAEVKGVPVEFLGDVRHRRPDGTWDAPLAIETTRIWVQWRDTAIPVLPLAYEALAYERMGRRQKAAQILSAIQRKSHD